ncbi:MAG: RdgB/HAM1 family non-canonical purine NTP pyrophosphatase [Gammaproteobacteria bacterium]|nr:RdgB/HAM1 family non-canonical purine NTP pyrophosphatase [Gammaproteobacteria bacterium]
MSELVLATANGGKVRELQALLAGHDYHVRTQAEFACPEVPETGLSFVENALIKARNAARHCGLPAIADDSGLACDALNGAPGIYSARYAGDHATDTQNLLYLLQAMKRVPEVARTCRYVCVIAYLAHADDQLPVLAQGIWEGRVTTAPCGTGGFGYDPIFFVPTDGCTAAELAASRKEVLSHRGQALRELIARLPRGRDT